MENQMISIISALPRAEIAVSNSSNKSSIDSSTSNKSSIESDCNKSSIGSPSTAATASGSDDDPSPSIPVVTGRKAARSLRLFRGDGYNILDFIDLDPNDDTSDIVDHETSLEVSDARIEPELEPVSSATYFPHTPITDKDETQFEDVISPSSSPPLAPSELEDDLIEPQHLHADVEFDHSDISQIQTRLKDLSINREETKKVVKFREDVDLPPSSNIQTSKQSIMKKTSHSESHQQVFPLAVELRPFKNKVGGHTAIFRFSKKAVCKALMNRENLWYETIEHMQPELLKFMPKYIGVLNVRYSSIITEEDSANSNNDHEGGYLQHRLNNNDEYIEDDTKTPMSSPQLLMKHEKFKTRSASFHEDDELPPEVVLDDNKHIIPDLLWKQYSNSAPSPPMFNSYSNDHDERSKSIDENTINDYITNKKLSPTNSIGPDTSIGSTSINTDLQVQVIREVFAPTAPNDDDQVFTMDEEDNHEERPIVRKHTRFERFILLEDLTADMVKPCALDLKMGTRQYGVDAKLSKQKSQRTKCKNTTSRNLGVRVCGLQVWDQVKKKFFTKDKYFGREIRQGLQFCKILAKFLYNGHDTFSILRKIPSLIKQLEELYQICRQLIGFRMYGSSILLMYDGNLKPSTLINPNYEEIKVRIIDFAQLVIENNHELVNLPPKYPNLPDMGYLKGLTSLIKYFKMLFAILTGKEYQDYQASINYLNQNHEVFSHDNGWLAEIDEVDLVHQPVLQGDPFDVDYRDDSHEEEGISD